MKPEKLTDEQVQNTLTTAIEAAVDYIESEIAPDQQRAQEYFDGKTKIKATDNRSAVVATKCRDVVRAVKPGLLRVFLQSGSPVEFIPTSSQAAQAAEQATKYANYVFEKNKGYSLLNGAFHDALVKKVGILKTFYDETTDAEIDEYAGITEEAIAYLEAQDDVEILEIVAEQEAFVDVLPMGVTINAAPPTFSVKVSRTTSQGEIKMEGIAPEDFFVDGNAKSIHDCFVCGHTDDTKRVGDFVAMGFDFDEVYGLGGDTDGDDEQQQQRAGYTSRDMGDGKIDKSMRTVRMTEAYMKMDIDGVGVPKLYKFICGGSKYKILSKELADYNPFSVFEIDPEPHTFFGRSLVEIVEDDQDAATSLLRGMLDNIAMMNNPGLAVDVDRVNPSDLLNNEIGRIIRVKGSPIGSIQEQTIGSAATMALPAIQHYDGVIREKTGITGAGMGLDVEALQSQTAAGVRMADQMSNAQSDFMARNLAEGGMKQTFKIIAELARAYPNANKMSVDGQYVEVDPRSWSADLDMRANVGLGTNRAEERVMAMQQLVTWQQGVWSQYGPQNGLVTMTGMRAAIADMSAIMGVHGIDKYIKPMNPEIEAQILAEQAQAAQNQPPAVDPNAGYVEGKKIDAAVKSQQNETDAQLKVAEMMRKDDLERDKMGQDLLIKAAEMINQPVPVQQVTNMQEMPRNG